MKDAKRIWNKKELIIAYYIAKWGIHGLGVESEDLVESVIGDTTVKSLEMQISNFRFILDLPGNRLEHAGATKIKLAEELQNVTYTNIKKMVLGMINESGAKIKKAKISRNNKQTMDRRDELNARSQKNFKNKMKEMNRHRRLRSLN